MRNPFDEEEDKKADPNDAPWVSPTQRASRFVRDYWALLAVAAGAVLIILLALLT